MSEITSFMEGYNNFMKTHTGLRFEKNNATLDMSTDYESLKPQTQKIKQPVPQISKREAMFALPSGNVLLLLLDPRTADWFLAGKLGHLLVILTSYVYFCTSAGPKYMKDKKPYDLKTIIQAYNLMQVFASAYLVYEGLQAGWINDYSFSCQPVVPGEKGLRMARAVWLYFMLKLVELLDTVFFVLRKKNNQVSYLHVYHHTLMPICAWIGVTFLPGGHGTLLGIINSFIHVIMYAYYFVAALGPEYQKYLWWKKHLTALQMVQFCMVFVHNFQVIFRDCDYPKFLNVLLSIQAGYFFYLFGAFYNAQYVKSQRKKKHEENGVISNGVEKRTNMAMNEKIKGH